MSKRMQGIIDDITAGQELLNCGTLSLEEYADALSLIEDRTRELSVATEALIEQDYQQYTDLLPLVREINVGFEAIEELSDIHEGLVALAASAESHPPTTDLQRQMLNVALEAYTDRLGMGALSVSQEGVSSTIQAIWNALVKAVETVVNRIKNFFRAIWRFITGKKRKLKDNDKKASDLSANDDSAAAFVKRQNDNIKAAKNAGVTPTGVPDTDDTVADPQRHTKEWLKTYQRFQDQAQSVFAKGGAKVQDIKNKIATLGDNDNVEETSVVCVEMSRAGRRLMSYASVNTQRAVEGEGGIITPTQFLEIGGGIESIIKDINDNVYNVTDIISEMTVDLTNTSADIHELTNTVIENRAHTTVDLQGHKGFNVSGGRFVRFANKNGNWVTSTTHHYEEQEFYLELPSPKVVSELTTKGIRLAEMDKTLKEMSKNVDVIMKVMETNKLEGLSEEAAMKLRKFINIYVERMLLPATQGCAEALTEYINLCEAITTQAINLYQADLEQ